MQHKFKTAFMQTAEIFANLSYARVLKVGAVIVKDNRILSIGYNGTLSGQDNQCEDPVRITFAEEAPKGREIFSDSRGFYYLKTRDSVLHAEMNAIMKIAISTESSQGATLITTHSPCIHCAKAIYQSGIAHIIFKHLYRDDSGLKFLENAGIIVEHLGETNDN